MKREFVEALDRYERGIGWPSLGEWVAHFTSVALPRAPDPRLVIGIDECAKQPKMIAAVESLERDGFSRGTRSLWSQLRETADGEPFFVVPATRRVRSSPNMWPSGRPVPGRRCPDHHVARSLVTLFTIADRVVLLSTNTKLDVEGLLFLLRAEVRPALLEHHHGRFSLLALFARPAGETIFAERIRPTVLAHPFNPGFTELVI